MNNIVIFLSLCLLLSSDLGAIILTNNAPRDIEFEIILKGRKVSDRQNILLRSRESRREFFHRWQRKQEGSLFQINVRDGRRQKNCAVQKGHIDHFEVIYEDNGRCMMRRI